MDAEPESSNRRRTKRAGCKLQPQQERGQAMTDEDVRNGMPFFDTPEQEEAWRKANGYSQNVPPVCLPELNPPPEFLQAENWFSEDISKDWLDPTVQFKSPDYTLKIGDVPVCPLGDIHGLTAQAGNGKTMSFCIIMATYLCGNIGELHSELTSLTEAPTLLYIDTEQTEAGTIGVRERVCNLAGLTAEQAHNNFRLLMLRECTTAAERWRKVLKAVYEIKPSVVFLDGLLDVVGDFNSNTECQELLFKLMATASYYRISLWCILHQNPNTTKMTGHAGSFLERKASDIFSVKKDTSGNDPVFTVSHVKARGRDAKDWQFRINPVGGFGLPEMINSVSSGEIPIEDIERWLQAGRNTVEWPCYASTIKEKIFKVYGNIRANDTLQACMERAKNRRFITEQAPEEFEPRQKHPKYYLNID